MFSYPLCRYRRTHFVIIDYAYSTVQRKVTTLSRDTNRVARYANRVARYAILVARDATFVAREALKTVSFVAHTSCFVNKGHKALVNFLRHLYSKLIESSFIVNEILKAMCE